MFRSLSDVSSSVTDSEVTVCGCCSVVHSPLSVSAAARPLGPRNAAGTGLWRRWLWWVIIGCHCPAGLLVAPIRCRRDFWPSYHEFYVTFYLVPLLYCINIPRPPLHSVRSKASFFLYSSFSLSSIQSQTSSLHSHLTVVVTFILLIVSRHRLRGNVLYSSSLFSASPFRHRSLLTSHPPLSAWWRISCRRA